MICNKQRLKFPRLSGRIPTNIPVPTNRGYLKLTLTKLKRTDYQKPNLTKEEREALVALKNNKDLVINSSDKGSMIVLQNRCDYIAQNLEHFNDTTTYLQLEGDPTEGIWKQIQRILHRLRTSVHLNVRFLYTTKQCPSSQILFPKKDSQKSTNYKTKLYLKTLPSYIQDTAKLLRDLSMVEVPQDA